MTRQRDFPHSDPIGLDRPGLVVRSRFPGPEVFTKRAAIVTTLIFLCWAAAAAAVELDREELERTEQSAREAIAAGLPPDALDLWNRSLTIRFATADLADEASTAAILERSATALVALERHAEAEAQLRRGR